MGWRGLGQSGEEQRGNITVTGGAGGKKASSQPALHPLGREDFVFLHPSQEVVKKEEKSGSGQSPIQGNLKKEDAAKTSKGSKCGCPSAAPAVWRKELGGMQKG